MSTISNKYSQSYIQKEVIDYLEKDGALCDYYSRYYKEQETYDGGVGDRKSFKSYNDKIIKYQNLLKILTGERRANIYEAIPAIDFLDPEYTSFYYTYPIETKSSSSKEVVNNTIIPIPKEEGKSASTLLNEEDPYTINRALMGEKIAEHFYNTSDLISTAYDLQVSPYILNKENNKYVYQGVISLNSYEEGVSTKDLRITDLLYYPVTSSTSMYFNPVTPRICGVFAEDGSNYLVDILQSDNFSDNNYIATNNIILNVDCGWNPVDREFKEITGYEKNIKHSDSSEFSGKTIITKVENEKSIEYNYYGHYQLNLDSGDYILAIPTNVYTLSGTKLLIFKKNNSESKVHSTYNYTTAYFNSYNNRFYENSDFSIAVNPNSEENKNKYFVPIEQENSENVYIYSELTTEYSKVNVISIDTTLKTITVEKSKNPYTCYVLYIQGFNKDINSLNTTNTYDPTSLFMKISKGDEMPTFLMEDAVFNILKVYIKVNVLYLSKASGLLSGYFSNPYEYSTSSNSCAVTKWSYVNEREKALANGMDIEIGSKYFSSHLLNRGSIISSPLRLTTKDSLEGKDYKELIAEGIKGKATLFYEKIKSLGDIYNNIFKEHKVSDNTELLKNYETLNRVMTYENFKDDSLMYKAKFKRENTDTSIGVDDILAYINAWSNILNGDTLTLDSNSQYTKSQVGVANLRWNDVWECWDTKYSGNTSVADFQKEIASFKNQSIENNSTILTYFSVKYATYQETEKCDLYFSFYTPLELFKEKKNSTAENNILVFPSEKKYFPESPILLSKKDLGLSVGKPVFFHKDGKLLGFLVKKCVSVLPSKIEKIILKKEGNYEWEYNIKDILNITENNVINSSFTDENYNSTMDYLSIPLVVDENYKFKGTYSYDSARSWISISEIKKVWKNILQGERDCYVYILDCITSESFTSELDLYDMEDEKIEFSNNQSYTKFYPFSYAVNSEDRLFKGNKITDTNGSSSYVVDTESRGDYQKLIGYGILCGVPNYFYKKSRMSYAYGVKPLSYLSKIRIYYNHDKIKEVNSFFSTFSSLLNDTQSLQQELVSSILIDLLSNWRISNSSVNPITLKELPQILEGLLSISKELHDLPSNGITIANRGRQLVLEKADFKNLISLIDKGETRRKYTILINKPTVTTFSSYSSVEDTCNNYLKAVFNNMSISLCNPDGTSWDTEEGKEYLVRNSIYSLNTIFNTLFTKEQITFLDLRTLCEQLDIAFGNDTEAFMSIGESTTVSGEKLDIGPSLNTLRERIISNLSDVLFNTIYTVISKTINNSTIQDSFTLLKKEYYYYYNKESVEKGVSFIDGEIKVNWDVLIPNIKRRSTIARAYVETGSASIRKVNTYFYEFYNSDILTGKNKKVITKYNSLNENRLLDINSRFYKDTQNFNLSKKDILNFLKGDTTVPVVTFTPKGNNKIEVAVTCPTFTINETNGVINNVSLSIGINSPKNVYTIENVFINTIDVTEQALFNLAEFTKLALEGSSEDASDIYAVKNVNGEDDEPIGRDNSLYYRRYKVLNNRMNRLHGNLWNASLLLRNTDVIKASNRLTKQPLDIYDQFVEIMPIQSMGEITYLPTQKAQLSADIIEGKYYSDAELEAMKELINDRCILTCTQCPIKDSCPFYSQEEVIKMYCTGIETIDFYVKDNKLDLLVYEQDSEGRYILPKITTTSDNLIDITKLTKAHIPYSEVVKKTPRDGVEQTYEIKNLDDIRSQLEGEPKLQYSEYVKDDLGWLLGARYGTIQKNNITTLIELNDEYSQYKNKLHPYKYMYDALFIADEETYVNYTPSRNIYKTDFDIKSNGQISHYDVETKIQIPSSLKIFADNNDDDDVYLISDDKKDANGEMIAPIIYLGKIKDIQYVFDLRDDGIEGGVKDTDDTKIYAQDVAQWCVNYYKGNCYQQPLNEEVSGVSDLYTNHDQYWMDIVYKNIIKDGKSIWCGFEGRKRVNSGYSTPLIDVEDYDEVQAISGRPVVADYINFIRKVSLRIYDRTTGKWTIPWINENLPFIYSDKYFKGLTTFEQKCEKQRTVLPLMKTNLRLAVVKN